MTHSAAYQQMVLDTLCTLLQDPVPEIRAKATQALGQIRHPDAISALLKVLNDPDEIVKQNAVIALSKMSSISPPEMP